MPFTHLNISTKHSLVYTYVSLFNILNELLNIFFLSHKITNFKSLFFPRVAEFIYIEGDKKRVCLQLEL